MHNMHKKKGKFFFLFSLNAIAVGCAILGPTLITDSTARDAALVGDTELIADVEALKNKHFDPGSAESQAGLCLQQYVRARAGEIALAKAQDDYSQRLARSAMLGGFSTCAQSCKLAAEQKPSQYSPIAARYQPRCVAGASGTEETIETAHLERLVASYRNATQPLGLFFADRDATALLDHLKMKNISNSTIESLATEVASLREVNTAAIAKGRAFFESPAAQENFRQRGINEGEQLSINGKIQRLEAERDEARAAGLQQRAENLGAEISALRVSLKVKLVEHDLLKQQYETMAEEAGVYTRP